MEIQAFQIIAVVAGLLSIVCGAPAGNEPNELADEPEKEDRSCTKREKDAEEAFTSGKTVESCNFFCKPYEDVDYYLEKQHPVGTKCKYGNLISMCTAEGCPYPTNSGGDKKKGEEKPEQEPNDEGKGDEKKEKEEESTTQGDEEKPGDKPNDEEGKEKEKEGEKEELTTQGEDGEEDKPKEKEPKGDEEKGKEEEEGEEGEQEEEEGELESESDKETSGSQ